MSDRAMQSSRLMVLLPQPDGDAGSSQAPVAMADLLAAEAQTQFEVVFVGGTDEVEQGADLSNRRVATVWSARHSDLGPAARSDRLVHACERALQAVGVERGADVLVLLPAGEQGDELAARLAVRFDGVALGRCIDIAWTDDVLHVRRAAYGARAHLTVKASRGPRFGTVRRVERKADATLERAPAPRVVRVEVSGPLPAEHATRTAPTEEQMLPLQGARLVIAGGRGMQSEAGFALLHELADALHAAVGGSLPAVDAGWVSVSRQVGQSGKYVSPRVYVAVGISGTPQHLAGIGPHTRIVAINSDPRADIFGVAELGVVADCQVLLPALLARVRAGVAAADAAAPQLPGGTSAA